MVSGANRGVDSIVVQAVLVQDQAAFEYRSGAKTANGPDQCVVPTLAVRCTQES